MNVQTDVIHEIQQKKLCWYEHVQRMENGEWMNGERKPKRIMGWIPLDRRRRGRPKCTWEQGIQKAMSERNLHPADWNDKRRWRLGAPRGRRRTL